MADEEQFYLADLKGEASCSSKAIVADKPLKLPDIPCKFVKLFNWTTSDTLLFPAKGGASTSKPSDAATATEIYYGFGEAIAGQIFAGGESPFLFVNNVNKITVRAAAGATGRVYFMYFW